jgi:putative ABC transport system permease protein
MVSNEERNIHFAERRWVFADSNVFSFFNIPLIEGSPSEALRGPSTVVLSESMANKYFGDGGQAVGKNVMLDKVNIFQVTGIMRDMPENFHLHFDFIASMENLKDSTRYYQFNVPRTRRAFSFYLQLHPADRKR